MPNIQTWFSLRDLHYANIGCVAILHALNMLTGRYALSEAAK